MLRPILFKPHLLRQLGPRHGPLAGGLYSWMVAGPGGGDILSGVATIFDIDLSPLHDAMPSNFVPDAADGVNPNTGDGKGAYAKPIVPGVEPAALFETTLTWIDVLSQAGSAEAWSKIPIADMDWFYGGFKEPRVLTWGEIARGLSDYTGASQATTFRWTLADFDRAIRGKFALQYTDPGSNIFRSRMINARAIDDASRREQQFTEIPQATTHAIGVSRRPFAAFTMFKGFVSDCKPAAGLTFEYTAQDYLSYSFDDASALFPSRRITAADFPGALSTPRSDYTQIPATIGWPVPIIYGHVTDTVVQDATAPGGALGVGQVPAIYVGTYAIGGLDYHKFLVCGHAVKSIDALYEHGVYLPFNLYAGPGAGAEWLIPGQAGWTATFGATPYEDINGHRYTVIYGKKGLPGPDDAAGFTHGVSSTETMPLTLSVQGIEDVGDGSGALIRDLLLQYLHCLVNWVLQTYQSGAWLSEPVFTDIFDQGVPLIDASSFFLASQMAKLRLVALGMSGAYEGAFILGASTPRAAGPFISTRDVIVLFNRCADVQSGFNRNAQFFVSMEPTPGSLPLLTAAPIPLLTAASDILEDSLSITDTKGLMFNYVPYLDTPDYFGRGSIGPWYVTGESSGGNDAQFGARRPPEPFEFPLLRTQGYGVGGSQGLYTRQSVVTALLHRHWRGVKTVTLSTPYRSYELGTVVALIHYGGDGSQAPGVGGYYYKLVRLTGQTVNVEKMTIDFEGEAIGDYDPDTGAVTFSNW